MARMTSHENVAAPKPDTWPSVSSPTSAQTVKRSMSSRRKCRWSFAFSSRPSAVV